ncbi:MAG TPA: hypothetical protein DEA08_29570 [Planctomycetes bacterium]|nr:hypothetical protein [Planctomycetota bacterium]
MSGGVIAAETKQPLLQFSWFKSLPYAKRLWLMAGFAAAGLAIQAYTLVPWYGLPLLLATVVLGWVVGFDNRLDRRGLKVDSAWEDVPYERVRELEELHDRMHRWDVSPFDLSNGLGLFTFLLLAGATVFLAMEGDDHGGEQVALIVAVDVVLLLGSQWLSGMRTLFTQPDLMIKVDHFRKALGYVKSEAEALGVLRAQLLMSGKGEERSPGDLKVSLQVTDAPEGFLGVQAQVVLNRVQGTPFPYLYAVVVARPGLNVNQIARELDGQLPKGVILESKRQDGVEIAIVRQQTTRTSGYHTKPAASGRILRKAFSIARETIARAGGSGGGELEIEVRPR